MGSATALPLLMIAAMTDHERRMQAMLYLGVLVVALLVLIVIVVAARKAFLEEDNRLDLRGEFSIEDLRQLLADGRITVDEFERAKQSVIRRGEAMLEERDGARHSDNG